MGPAKSTTNRIGKIRLLHSLEHQISQQAAMGFIEETIGQGEHIVYRTQLSSIVVATYAVSVALLGLLVSLIVGLTGSIPLAVAITFIISAASWLVARLTIKTSEFAVTNKRVIMKSGVLSTRTLEVLLQQIESIQVRQGIFGRMFDFGTVLVGGTGGSKEPFVDIECPNECRKHIQRQIEIIRRASEAPTTHRAQ